MENEIQIPNPPSFLKTDGKKKYNAIAQMLISEFFLNYRCQYIHYKKAYK